MSASSMKTPTPQLAWWRRVFSRNKTLISFSVIELVGSSISLIECASQLSRVDLKKWNQVLAFHPLPDRSHLVGSGTSLEVGDVNQNRFQTIEQTGYLDIAFSGGLSPQQNILVEQFPRAVDFINKLVAVFDMSVAKSP